MARLVFSAKETKGPFNVYKLKNLDNWRKVNLSLEASNKQWWEDPDVVVAFNLPRISACLERLMGTNVVRLTDRKYMSELRQRIDEDYSQQLQKRINARELREIERERLLIIEGKTQIIPEELMDDPIFVVDQKANKVVIKQRAKLKTNRERNSERLKVQGIKWEKERLLQEEEESRRMAEVKARRKSQKQLEERYKEEDAERGMDLLRIQNDDWRDCEQKLREFLERERCRMKERSWRVPTPYSTDPQDIQNIIRARQKFRETQNRIQKQLDVKLDDKIVGKDKESKKTDMKDKHEFADIESIQSSIKEAYSLEKMLADRRGGSDDLSITTSETSELHESSTLSESIKRHAGELTEGIDNDVERGLIISKEQYEHLRYEDEKIVQLRLATDIRELYEIAELIIIGEREEDLGEENEFAEEEVADLYEEND